MSYYYNKKIYDTYKISELFNTNTTLTKDVIEICNNEDFIIDLTQCTFKSNMNGVENVELNKVIINWGDGEVTKLIRPINHSVSTISNVKENSWKKTSHKFNVDKRNVYLTDNVTFLDKIKIKLYSTFNDVVTILIPYKIVYKSLYDLGTNFELLQANVANNNLTQFVLKEGVNDSITIVSAKDWKKIYGDSNEINYINDNKISVDYSDEYIDYDKIVWDWNAVPYVELYNIDVDKSNKIISCYFNQKNVILDDWTPNCEKILDDGNISYDKDSNENVKENNYFECKFKDSLDNSLFRIYLDVVGINGVKGKSDYFYAASSSNFANTITYLKASSIPSEDDKLYNFNLSLNVQWKHLETAKMILTPIRWAASSSIYSSDVIDIGLTTTDNFSSSEYEDSDVSYSFEYNITNDGIIIDPYSLPNGKYQISYYIKDLLGNVKREVDGGATEHVVYINSDSIPAPVFSDFSTTNELIDIKWQVTSNKQDKTVLKIVKDNKIIANIKEPYDSNKNIVHSLKGNIHEYCYTIDGNTIPDGTYHIYAGNCIDMNNFVGCRQKAEYKEISYTYPSPKINISSINVYPKWNATTKTWNPYLQLYIEDSGRPLKNVTLQYGVFGDSKYENYKNYNLSQSNVYDIPLSEISDIGNTNYVSCRIEAAYDSDLHDRKGHVDVNDNYTIKKTGEINSLFMNNPSFISDTLDLSKYYKNELTQETNIPGSVVQQESAFDVNKKYVINYTYNYTNLNGEKVKKTETFYSPVDSPKYYNCDGKEIWYAYRTIEYTDESNSSKTTRFINDGSFIIVDESDTVIESNELPTVETYLNEKGIQANVSYDKKTDTSTIKFSCLDNKLANEKDIQYAYLDLYNSVGNHIYRQDVRKNFYTKQSNNQKYIEISLMTPSKYTGKILFSSLNTANMKTNDQGIDETTLEDITYDLGIINALVPATDALSAQTKSEKNPINDNYFDVIVKYTINHKQFESLKLVYKIGDNKEKTVNLNTSESSTYELPEQIAPNTTVKYHFLGVSPLIKNCNLITGSVVGKPSYTFTTPSKPN